MRVVRGEDGKSLFPGNMCWREDEGELVAEYLEAMQTWADSAWARCGVGR